MSNRVLVLNGIERICLTLRCLFASKQMSVPYLPVSCNRILGVDPATRTAMPGEEPGTIGSDRYLMFERQRRLLFDNANPRG